MTDQTSVLYHGAPLRPVNQRLPFYYNTGINDETQIAVVVCWLKQPYDTACPLAQSVACLGLGSGLSSFTVFDTFVHMPVTGEKLK